MTDLLAGFNSGRDFLVDVAPQQGVQGGRQPQHQSAGEKTEAECTFPTVPR